MYDIFLVIYITIMHNIFGLGFLVLFNIAPLFQMVVIVKNKNSYNNSYGLWMCGVLGQICVLGYYYSLKVDGIFNYINSITGLILNIVMVIMIYVYRKKD